MATKLRSLRLNRCDLVDQPANPLAHVVLYKRATATVAAKSVMPSSTRSELPDSAFAAVWTDGDGNKQRKLPYKHADGSVDMAHLRNALSRISQTDMPSSVRAAAQHKLNAAKEKYMKKSIWKRLAELFKEAEAGALADWANEEEQEHGIKSFHGRLIKALEGFGTDEFPPEHPISALKTLCKEMGDYISASAAPPAQGEPAPPAAPSGEGLVKSAEEVAKAAADEAVVKAVADISKKLAETEAVLKAERDASALAAEVALLKSIKLVSVNPDADAPIFKSLKETNIAAYDRVMELIKGADAVAAASDLIKEVGSPLSGDKQSGNTAWAQIEAEADALRKSDTKVTKAQAIDIVMKKRPDLVKAHYEEQGA